MSIIRIIPTALLGIFLITSIGHTQGLRAVKALDGTKCMEPNISEEQMLKQGSLPAIHQDPSSSSPEIGRTASQIITYEPARVQNGFVEVLTPLGKQGWVRQSQLVPYQNASRPNTKCIPSLMSNGRPGFAFTH